MNERIKTAKKKSATSITGNVENVEKKNKNQTIQRNIWHVLSFVVRNACCSMFKTPCLTRLSHPFYLRFPSKFFLSSLCNRSLFFFFIFSFVHSLFALLLFGSCSGVGSDDVRKFDLINAYGKRSTNSTSVLFFFLPLFRPLHPVFGACIRKRIFGWKESLILAYTLNRGLSVKSERNI